MGIGAGYYFAAASVSVLILVVLAILPYGETIIERHNQSKTYSIQCLFSTDKRTKYEELMKQYKLKPRLIKEIKEGNDLSVTWQAQGHAGNHQQFIAFMMNDDTLKQFGY